jgi:hypothetical protein
MTLNCKENYRENKIELEKELDGLQDELEMNQEEIDHFTIDEYYLSIQYKDYLGKKDVNAAFLESKKIELEHLKNQIKDLKELRSSIMNSIDDVNCRLAVTESFTIEVHFLTLGF